MRTMLLRVIPLVAIGGCAALVLACGSSGGGGSPSPNPTQGPTLDSYVANVCKAAAALEQQAGQFAGQFGGQFRNGSATPDTSATADPSGTPANAASARTAVTTAANTFLNALRVANPPPDLVSYNNQLIQELQTSVTDLGTGNFANGGGGAFANRTPNGTPFARPSGTPGARFDGTPRTRPAGAPGADGTPGARTPFSGTPGANGPAGGGLARLLFRNLPAVPAQYADQMDQAASANADCQSAQFSFSTQ